MAAAPPGRWVPQHHRDITLGRIEGFLAQGQFADANIRADMWAKCCADCITLEVYSHPKDLPYPKYEDAVRMPYRPAKVGDEFGPSWTTHWFRVRAAVPREWDGLGPLMFRWDSGSEALLYGCGDPTPLQGLTDQRNEYVLAERAVGGQELHLYVEMVANSMFGNGPPENNIQPPDENKCYKLKTVQLAIPHAPATALFHDLRALHGLAKELGPGDATGETALYTANKIINTYRRGDAASLDACRAMAAEVLGVRDPGQRMQVYAVGHCHIDTAWLWPFSETHRKVARSWSAQLRLAERFPWHVFTASSAQQYEWLRQDYPGLFVQVQAAAQRGSFVPVGGTWVEMDTNVPSGESLVRQFLYGQRFFVRHFGAPCDVFWLPDTFGYSGQLPQIARQAGIRSFLTQKLSWNNINAFPHSTFLWAGLDGTELLTHFPPANTYNAQADAKDILATATGSKDKDRAPAAYMLYGNGDGGGGPTPDMCESLARLAGCRGVASVTLAAPSAFFRTLEGASRDLLTWRGELYFELHRGTYTSHAANKADNRACELLLREAEAAGAMAAALLHPGSYCYPKSELDALWQDVLLFQFHDVLPGSCIKRVYDTTAQRYPVIKSTLRRIRDSALQAVIAAASAAPPPPTAAPTGAAAAPTAFPAGGALPGGLSPAAPSSPIRPHAVAGAVPLPYGSPPTPPAMPVPSAYPPLAPAGYPGYGSTGEYGSGYVYGQEPAVVAWVFNSLAFPRREVVAVPVAALGGGGGAVQLSDDGREALMVAEVGPLSFLPVTRDHVMAGVATSPSYRTAAAQGVPYGQGQQQQQGSGPGQKVVGGVEAAAAGLQGLGLGAGPRAGAGPTGAGTCVCRREVRMGGGQGPGVAGQAAAGGGSGHEVLYLMQNEMIRAVFDDAGRLVSLFDPVWVRELLPEGQQGNVFRYYEDIPLFWDAWDIEVYHLEKGWPAGQGLPPPQVRILEPGPLRCRLQLSAALSATSSLQQTITLTATSPRIEFHTEVVWHEARRALKVEFPLDLDAPAATYEVQFGAVQRPTHTNTSWDWARFEVCAHKWADLSEPGYGVALLNDCKYGHATHGHVMRLTLLRSPKAPDPQADQGTHVLRYGLLPHAHGWQAAGVVAAAAAFNTPLRVLQPPPQPPPAGAAAPYGACGVPAFGAGVVAGLAAGTYGGGGAGMVARGEYDPMQPLFMVTSALPDPLAPSATTSAGPLRLPPLVLETVKLAEPPIAPQHAAAPPATSAAAGPTPHGPYEQMVVQQQQQQQQRYSFGAAPMEGQQGQGQVGSCSGCSRGSEAGSPLVLRLYEPHGARGVARVWWPRWLHVARVVPCDLLENDMEGQGPAAAVGEPYSFQREGGAGGSGGAAGVGKRQAGKRPLVVGRAEGGTGGGWVDVLYGPFQIISLKVYLGEQR